MKVANITTTNQKGQIVIPQKLRSALNITPDVPLNIVLSGNAIHLYPIQEVITKTERENSYASLLKLTQGTWKEKDWTLKRKSLELKASLERKKKW